MSNSAVVIPCAVLGAIAVCMFVFICWWFPRAWAKGQTLDMREFADNVERQRQREIDLEEGANESTNNDTTNVKTSEAAAQNIRVPQKTYTPPIVTSF